MLKTMVSKPETRRITAAVLSLTLLLFGLLASSPIEASPIGLGKDLNKHGRLYQPEPYPVTSPVDIFGYFSGALDKNGWVQTAAKPVLPSSPDPGSSPLANFLPPTTGYMGYGYVPGHNGDDIWTDPSSGCACVSGTCNNPPGNVVQPAYPGTVQHIYYTNHASGLWFEWNPNVTPPYAPSVVVLSHTNIPGVGNRITLYLHMANDLTNQSYINPDLRVGQVVGTSSYLGRQGNWDYGDNDPIVHLHFEVADNMTSPRRTYNPMGPDYLGLGFGHCSGQYMSTGQPPPSTNTPTRTPTGAPPTNTHTRTPTPNPSGAWTLTNPSYNVQPNQQVQVSVQLHSNTYTFLTTNSILDSLDAQRYGAYQFQPVESNVYPGQNYTFNRADLFTMTSPSQPGTYTVRWQMRVSNNLLGPISTVTLVVGQPPPPPTAVPPGTWRVQAYPNESLSGSPCYDANETIGSYVFKDWGWSQPPGGSCPAEHWSVRITKQVSFSGGTYSFHCEHDDGCRVYIDGTLRIDEWGASGGHDWGGNISAGNHEVKVEFRENTGLARVEVWWRGPGALPNNDSGDPSQWYVDYYGIRAIWGTSVLGLRDGSGFISHDWRGQGNSAGFGLPSENWAARFSRTMALACGTYRFTATADDGVRLEVNNQALFDFGGGPPQTRSADVSLPGGNVPITLYYYQAGGDAYVSMDWQLLSACVPPTSTPAPPVASFDAWPQSGNAPLTSSMHNISTGDITSCSWSYGDGATGTSCARYHDHVYTSIGSYTVSLTVTGPGGSNTMTRNNYISVSGGPPPTNTAIASPTSCTTGNYSFSVSSGSIVQGITDIGNHCDDCTTTISLPFAYTLYNQSYTSATIGSNGLVAFGATDNAFTNACLPAVAANYEILPFWDDQITAAEAGKGIYTSISGNAPNRIFNIEFRTCGYNSPTTCAPGSDSNYEVRLYEGQSRFDIIYGVMGLNGSSATIGVQKNSATYTQYSCNTAVSGLNGRMLIGTASNCPPTTTPVVPTPTCTTGGGPIVVNGALTTSDPTLATRLFRADPPSTCAAPIAFPGPSGTGPYYYDTYTYPNTTGASACITVNVNPLSCTGTLYIHASAYMNSFDPNNLGTNFLGTLGASPVVATDFSVTVPAGQSIVVVVNAVTAGTAGACPGYTLTISGLGGGMCSTPTVGIPTPVPTGVPTTGPTPCAIQFTDVPSSNTFYAYVRCLACRNIDSGYACGGPNEPCDPSNNRYFRPNTLMTRDDLSHMVAAAAGFNENPGPQRFEDVPTSHPFFPWINRMAMRGLIGGYPCGGPGEPCIAPDNRAYFRPGAYATRGQIAKIVANGAGYSENPSGQMFEDVPSNQAFYVWVQRLASRGAMGGYPCGGVNEPCGAESKPYFRWGNLATRGQISKIVANTFFPNCQTPNRERSDTP